MLELAILGLLKDQPLHGYELKKRLAEDLGVAGAVSFGSLYPALRRLEKTGAITAAEAEATGATRIPMTGSLAGEAAAARRRHRPVASRRIRKAYRLTARGEQLFDELLTADAAGGADDERTFALRLVFARYLDPAARLRLLERRRAELSERLDTARRSRGTAIDRYARSLAEHRVRSVELDLAWVEQLIRAESAPAEGVASA